MPIINLNNFCVAHKRNFIFTDIDLDGAMSYLLFEWYNKKRIPYIATRVTDFRASFSGWLKHHKLTDYDTVYILDLDVSNECQELVDKPNIVIVDHHESHVQNKHKYKKAKTFISTDTSCARLLYKLLYSKSDEPLSDEYKKLVLLVDDYDSYSLKVPNSHELNTIFWNYQGDKVKKFVEDFGSGFHEFTSQQEKIIDFYKKKLSNVISSLDIFEGIVPIGSAPTKVVSTFANTCINDVADYIIKDHDADIGMVVNMDSKKVSFRKDKQCPVDLSLLAKTIADGGGHKYAAGGKVSDKFITFTKLLKPKT
tara:strand:+ start:278 stop:1207 length:930 start_codon:yes stop_codon:yes gene_type:complete